MEKKFCRCSFPFAFILLPSHKGTNPIGHPKVHNYMYKHNKKSNKKNSLHHLQSNGKAAIILSFTYYISFFYAILCTLGTKLFLHIYFLYSSPNKT